jgi:oligopeptide transport system substrate-binding protein
VAVGEQILRLPALEPATLDPGIAGDPTSFPLVVQLFEGLVDVDAHGAVYGVQARDWQISEDGLEYTFHLRDGLRWSDGRLLTARDYERAWKRNIDPATRSGYPAALYPIRNARLIHGGGAPPDTLGVRAEDSRTLVVLLEQPAPYFLRLASVWTLYPLPSEAMRQAGDRWAETGPTVTNGPFRVESWRHDEAITLVRNDHYRGPRPALERVVYRIIPDGGEVQALAAYEAGELDMFPPELLLPRDVVGRLRAGSQTAAATP